MVLGYDSGLRGRGFKSRRCILDGHDFFALISCQNCIVCLKRPKNEKEAWVGHFSYIYTLTMTIDKSNYDAFMPRVWPQVHSLAKTLKPGSSLVEGDEGYIGPSGKRLCL